MFKEAVLLSALLPRKGCRIVEIHISHLRKIIAKSPGTPRTRTLTAVITSQCANHYTIGSRCQYPFNVIFNFFSSLVLLVGGDVKMKKCLFFLGHLPGGAKSTLMTRKILENTMAPFLIMPRPLS